MSTPTPPHSGTPMLTLVRSLRLIWEADSPRATAYLLVTVIAGVVPVAAAWLAKLVLDRAGAALLQPGDATLAGSAFAAAVWYVAIQFVGRFLEPVGHQLKGNLDAQVTGHVEHRLMAVGGSIPDLDHFERRAFHDEIDFITREVSWRPKNLTIDLHEVARTSLTLVGSLALLWRFQPLLALALLLTCQWPTESGSSAVSMNGARPGARPERDEQPASRRGARAGAGGPASPDRPSAV